MKKFIAFLSIVLFSALAFTAQAQITLTEKDPAGATSTVNTNADTSYHSVDLGGQNNNFEYLTFSIKGTKTSGTVAGAITLWGSNDNSKWFAVYGASTSQMADTVTTQSLSDGDNDKIFIVNKTRFRYYRVRVITTGTQVSAYDCLMLGRKVPN